MQQRHTQREINSGEQSATTAAYVLPFVEAHRAVTPAFRVLEIGCGEGGNLGPFLDRGCAAVGVDVDATRIAVAERHFAAHPHRDRLELLAVDVHALVDTGQQPSFDLVMLRDAFEHIPQQERLLAGLARFLAPGGLVFIGFPPWQHPFGGHQHHLRSALLSQVPYLHLLPRSAYRGAMRAFGESPATIEELLAIRSTGLSIERFERMLRAQGYEVVESVHYLVNPHYEVKFGLAPRRQLEAIRRLPWLRNFVTTTAYYLLRPAAG